MILRILCSCLKSSSDKTRMTDKRGIYWSLESQSLGYVLKMQIPQPRTSFIELKFPWAL